MKAMLRGIDNHGVHYQALAFVCPGCLEFGGIGLHLLPVNTSEHSPAWNWNGNLELPTLSPSILTKTGPPDNEHVCHSFLENGLFRFLSDCSHTLANKEGVPMPDLPDWFTKEQERSE